MSVLAQTVGALAAFVVLAEALNKIERADLWGGRTGRNRLAALAALLRPRSWQREHVVTVLKVAGWCLMSVGAAGSLITAPGTPAVLVLAGFALLIVRSRVKEG